MRRCSLCCLCVYIYSVGGGSVIRRNTRQRHLQANGPRLTGYPASRRVARYRDAIAIDEHQNYELRSPSASTPATRPLYPLTTPTIPSPTACVYDHRDKLV